MKAGRENLDSKADLVSNPNRNGTVRYVAVCTVYYTMGAVHWLSRVEGGGGSESLHF